MEVVITIFKDQLQANARLQAQLANLSVEVKETSTAILYIPHKDSLIEFIRLLHEFKISFGAHTSEDEILKIIRENGSGVGGNKG